MIDEHKSLEKELAGTVQQLQRQQKWGNDIKKQLRSMLETSAEDDTDDDDDDDIDEESIQMSEERVDVAQTEVPQTEPIHEEKQQEEVQSIKMKNWKSSKEDLTESSLDDTKLTAIAANESASNNVLGMQSASFLLSNAEDIKRTS